MKRLSLTIVLCLTIALSYGQKKALNEAKRELNNAANPNIEDARKLIKGALEDPETKDNAETWFVAGKIEVKVVDYEIAKELIQKVPNEELMYGALKNVKPYFEVADSLDLIPDAKGKVKIKYRKDMKAIMLANRIYYLNGGSFYYNNKDYQNAFDMFQQFFDVPKMKMFEDDNAFAAKDTAHADYRYYAGLSLAQYGKPAQVAAFFETIKDIQGYSNSEYYKDIYKYLCTLYEQDRDTVNFIRTLEESTKKFPGESYFLLNLINQYVFTNQGDAAIKTLGMAIEAMPGKAELYNVLGIVYENSKKDAEKAKLNYEKALSIDPELVDAMGNIGRILFNKAVEAHIAANEITDNKKYEEAKLKFNEMFREALPYFEKAHQMKPNEREYMTALSRIYYVLGDKKFDEIEKKLNQ